ncbi:NUDIX domain-containing protein [uncultured Amnibacterium sp.]|uniref:NUDIX domain-containing protein n=1 Tax=uncultured Amnibacterium sp. TaxID=1631851 RepID=UPI0035CA2F51
MEDRPEEHPLTGETLLHHGRVWDVARETFDYGGTSIVREVIRHPGAVAILALDDDGRVLLIRQYRHPIHARAWEIPAGLLDEPGEPPLEAAQRELAEEADLAATTWHVLADFQNSPGGSDETIRVYLARGVSAVPAFSRSEEEADIEVRWVPLDDVVDAVLARRVQSPSLVVGALAAVASRARDWATLAPGDEPWLRHPVAGGAPWRTR